MIVLLFICIIMAFNPMAIGQEAAPSQGECPPNSTMSGCGNRCEPKCGDPPGCKPCVIICDPPACACANGYARNSQTGQCVLVAECPNERQPRNVCNPPCAAGYVCMPREVQCFVPPCPPIHECVPASTNPNDNPID